MGEGKFAISAGFLLALDVAPEVVAWDNHVHGKEYVIRIVDSCPVGNNLCVVVVKVGG